MSLISDKRNDYTVLQKMKLYQANERNQKEYK